MSKKDDTICFGVDAVPSATLHAEKKENKAERPPTIVHHINRYVDEKTIHGPSNESNTYHISFESESVTRMFALYIVPALEKVALFRINNEIYLVDPKSRLEFIEDLAMQSGAISFSVCERKYYF